MAIYKRLPLRTTIIPTLSSTHDGSLLQYKKKADTPALARVDAHGKWEGICRCGYVNLHGPRVADNWYWPIIGGLRYPDTTFPNQMTTSTHSHQQSPATGVLSPDFLHLSVLVLCTCRVFFVVYF